MASKKDMRRADLIVPYQEPPPSNNETVEFSSTLATTLPMAAMMTRNRYIGWGAVAFCVQNWLGESDQARRTSSTPAYFSVGIALMSLVLTYLPIFLPQANARAPVAST